MLEKIKGVRKLSALLLCVLAGLIGGVYMEESFYIAFVSLLATGLGIFSYSNIQEHKC